MSEKKPRLITSAGAPVPSSDTPRLPAPGAVMLDDYHLIEELAHQNQERIPERVVYAKGWGSRGTFTPL